MPTDCSASLRESPKEYFFFYESDAPIRIEGDLLRFLRGLFFALFEYGGGAKDVSGFSYQASNSWQMTDRWTMMMLASSYFQPSEQEYGGVVRVHNASWGVGHSMIRGKLNATFDLNSRHESREYTEYYASEYDQDIFTGRIGLNYTINRFIVAFTNLEYQKDWIGGNQYKSSYDYDRWRLTVGLRLTY